MRNASREELAYNDDSGGSKNSQITFIATTTGRHYLEARGHKTNIGNYQLSAVTTDFANLTTAQLSSLSEVRCKCIAAGQISRLSTAQISALKSFDLLSADAFAGLTAEQIKFVSTGGVKGYSWDEWGTKVLGNSWRFMTAAQISKLTPAAFGAMSSWS